MFYKKTSLSLKFATLALEVAGFGEELAKFTLAWMMDVLSVLDDAG